MALLCTLEETHKLPAKMTFTNISTSLQQKKKVTEFKAEKFLYIEPQFGHINLMITKKFLFLQIINPKVQYISHIGCSSW